MVWQRVNYWFQRLHQHRIPLVLQYEMVECGAACLSMILRHYGGFLPLHELRSSCGVSRDGSNLLDIKKAAEGYGLNARAGRVSADQLFQIEGLFPCIAWWDFNHFVVLAGPGHGRMQVVDPALGRYALSPGEVQKHFSGMVLQLSPCEGFRPSGKRENQLLQLVPLLRRYRQQLFLLAPLTIALLVPSVLEPALSGVFVGEVLTNERYQYALPILWLAILSVVLMLTLGLIRLRVLRVVYLQLSRLLFNRIARKLLLVNYGFYSTRYLGDISSRVEIGDQISSVLALELAPFLLGVITAVALIPVVWLISPQLSLLSLSYVLISIILALMSTSLLLDRTKLVTLIEGKVSGLALRIFSDTRSIKASALESQYLAKWQELYQPVFDQHQSIQATLNAFSFAESLNGSLYEWGSIALSGYLVILGDLNLAGFMAFQAIRSQVTQPLVVIGSISQSLQNLSAQLARLQDLQSVPDDLKVRSLELSPVAVVAADVDLEAPAVSLQAEDVSVQFSALKPPLLRHVSFSVVAGSMVTLVGPSGAGKSVLLKTLTGFYEPSQGQILYGGRPWSAYGDAAMRKAVGYVSQEVLALRGTVLENLTLHEPGYSTDQVWSACEAAAFSEVVHQLPAGLDTKLGQGGSGLSGGQLQRLQIARALLRSPRLLFLDEATSALDIPTETQLLSNLRGLGITLVCVAHRLISAQMSDQVVAVRNGEVIEIGSPVVLSADPSSFYAALLQADRAMDPLEGP